MSNFGHSALRRWLLRSKVTIEDRLRHSPSVRCGLLVLSEIKEWFRPRKSDLHKVEAVERLCGSVRLAIKESQRARLERRIDALVSEIDPAAVAPTWLEPEAGSREVRKGLVLKPRVGPREKGVIFISFEYQWTRFLNGRDLSALAEEYTLVVSPTWSPPHKASNYLFPRIFSAPIHCLISNREDLQHFPRISSCYRMVDLYASSWVSSELFRPVPFDEKSIDILMVANFSKYKRHFALFRALRELPSDLRVVLIGQPNGRRTADVLMREAEAFGVADRIELMPQVSNESLVDCLCRAKISLILSRREGSCVAVVESMMANTPVGLLEGAHVGSAAFLNEETGSFLREARLSEDLERFLSTAEQFSPRRRLLEEGICAARSSEILNEHLMRSAMDDGAEWTRDIIPLHWRPNPLPIESSDHGWVMTERARIEKRFGLRIGQDLTGVPLSGDGTEKRSVA